MNNRFLNLLDCLIRDLGLSIPIPQLRDAITLRRGVMTFSAIREILLDFGICCKSYSLGLSELTELEAPYIIQIGRNDEKEDLVLVRKKDDRHFHLYSADKGTFLLTFSDLAEIYTGVVLIPFVDEYSGVPIGEKGNDSMGNGWIKYVGGLTVGILFVLMGMLQIQLGDNNWGYWMYFLLLSSIGLWLSVQIVGIEHYRENDLARRVCEKDGCHKVLHSKAARPIGKISMGYLGTVYFLSSMLSLCSCPALEDEETVFSFLVCCSFLALPYTLFSVYYQKFVVRSWCPFCLSVMALFWLEAAGSTCYLVSRTFCGEISVLILILWFVWVSVFCCILLHEYFSKTGEGEQSRQFIHWIKKDVRLFHSSLQLQKELSAFPTDLAFPVLSDGESEHEVRLVLSPSCSLCVKMFRQALEVAEKYPHLCRMLLCIRGSNKSAAESKVAGWMYSAWLHDGVEAMTAVHQAWLDLPDKSLSLFEQQMISSGTVWDKKAEGMLTRQEDWFLRNNMISAPVILYNGKELPRWYLFYDLIKLMIRTDHENF